MVATTYWVHSIQLKFFIKCGFCKCTSLYEITKEELSTELKLKNTYNNSIIVFTKIKCRDCLRIIDVTLTELSAP